MRPIRDPYTHQGLPNHTTFWSIKFVATVPVTICGDNKLPVSNNFCNLRVKQGALTPINSNNLFKFMHTAPPTKFRTCGYGGSHAIHEK